MILCFSALPMNSGEYIGQKLRERSFDPKGTGTSTMLDNLVMWRLMRVMAALAFHLNDKVQAVKRNFKLENSLVPLAQKPCE